MGNFVILAQDPSFAKLSFSLYDGKETIYLDSCKFKFGDCIGFEDVFTANINIWEQYKNKLIEEYGINSKLYINKIFSEIPPPAGIFSAGLFSLDTYILDRLFYLNKDCDEIFTLPPSFLMTVHNSRKYKKSESTVLAKYLMNTVLKDKFQFKFTGQMNADRSESLFFLLRAFVKYNIKDSKDLIIQAISGFLSESEKLLITRS